MIQRDELTAFLDDYLACALFNDYSPNGMQIEGKSEIRRICTAVTACHDIIQRANHLKADALLVHHGYFWRGEAPVLTGMMRQRVGSIISHDLNLFAYHLPLDCHQDIGNNACIGRLLDVHDRSSHAVNKIPDILWSGSFQSSVDSSALMQQLTHLLNRQPLHVSGSNKKIKRIAWCSGSAQDFIVDAHRLGVDAYISGEVSERTYYQAQELGIHYFACGHHATERFGIQALGRLLSERFALTHAFLDSDNPV